MGKIGPQSDALGTTLYPGFYKPTRNSFLLQRLETGSQRTQRGQIRPTNGSYARIPIKGLFTQNNGDQSINLASATVRKIGGVAPTANTSGFAFVGGTNDIAWYWDGTNGSTVIILRRADGTKFRIPIAGSGLDVTGLLATTDYYFLPFWNPSNTCNIGWVPGTVGTPQIAFTLADTTNITNSPAALIAQTGQGSEPLTAGYMKATTGSSGGGGGGGGGGFCVMSGTQIVPLGDSSYHVEVHSETEWVHVRTEGGNELNCTVNHPLFQSHSGQVRADMVKVGDVLIMEDGEQRVINVQRFQRKCSKYKVEMEHGHLFWANGFLSHNQKVVPGV